MIKPINNGFEVSHKGMVFLRHTDDNPALFVGNKNITFDMDKGEFHIHDNTTYKPATLIQVDTNKIIFDSFEIDVIVENNLIRLQPINLITPLKIKLHATKEESIFGLGEHFTSLNLRGHQVKNWVEEHITRKQIYNKIFRRLVKLPPKKWKFEDYKTYFITPSFISSKNYFCHIESDGYGVFDFTNPTYHGIRFVSTIKEIVFSVHEDQLQTVAALNNFKGIFPLLPDWVHDGMILGIQGGTKVVDDITQDLLQRGAKINGIWAQDWCGELFTYFGKQVLWNWEVDNNLYPNLKEQINKWDKQNVKFLSYVNPYLNANEIMFKEAKELDYLVKNKDGSPFLTQATSFKFGIVDLTKKDAYTWFKNIIKKNYIELGIKGWMADFGEYLPTECILEQGSGEELHNVWPDLWIQLNREVLEETNMLSKVLFFNRAGYSNNASYTTLVWNGDQHVDFTDDFGMKSVIRAALSLSYSGIGISHSDVGGYTTVPGITRSKELYLRWLEMNTFSPVLRSHEGNKPWSNVQPYTDEETKNATVLFSNIHVLLKPYIKHVESEYQMHGYPMIRPISLHYNQYSEYEYLFGQDIFVSPVMKKRRKKQKIVLPDDTWVHFFTGKTYQGGNHLVEAPIGVPPIFYRQESTFTETFTSITNYIKNKAA